MDKGLLILRINLFTNRSEWDTIQKGIREQISTGVLILPPYIDAIVVPDDLEIRFESPDSKTDEGASP